MAPRSRDGGGDDGGGSRSGEYAHTAVTELKDGTNPGQKPVALGHLANAVTPIGHNELMADRLLTPSKITAWLDCAHFLTLQHEVEARTRPKPSGSFGEFAALTIESKFFLADGWQLLDESNDT